MEESFTGERKAFSADVGDEPVRDPHLRGIRRPSHSDQPHARALCNRRAGLVGGAPSDVTQQIGVHRCREHGQRLDDLPCGVADGEQAEGTCYADTEGWRAWPNWSEVFDISGNSVAPIVTKR